MSHPPKVEECLRDIKAFCDSVKADKNGEKQIDVTDIMWIIARFDQSVEDYIQRHQLKIPLGDKTDMRLHYRPREAAND